MEIAASIFASLAAVIHVYIFVMESITWTSARTRGTFGLSLEEAEATKEMALNQGFYNLFLAIVTGAGLSVMWSGESVAGPALIFAGAGSMAAAAVVLFATSPDKRSAALKQGVAPLLAVVTLAAAVISG